MVEGFRRLRLRTERRADVHQAILSLASLIICLHKLILVLLDPTRTLRFESTAAAHVTILVPRRELRIRPAQIDRLIGVRIDGSHGPGALVSVLARESARSATGFREAEALRSAAAVVVVELIVVALEARLGDEQPAPDEWLRDRITGYIEARLADPDLSPPGIAAAHYISVRTVTAVASLEKDGGDQGRQEQ
jgi:hypothetical protein